MNGSQKKPLAIFDIDGTIFRSALAIELVHQLVAEHIFPPQILVDIEDEYIAWLNREGTYETYIQKIVDVYGDYLKGTTTHQMQLASQHVITTHKKRVYQYTRDLIKKLTHEGYVLVAISGSPDTVVHEFRKSWGFHHSFGTEFEVIDGMFTGKVLAAPAQGKKQVLHDFIKKYGFSLKGSIGVGDTESDISFLEEVDHPIAFNPNAKLKKEAQERGWKIVVERKDVVWEL